MVEDFCIPMGVLSVIITIILAIYISKLMKSMRFYKSLKTHTVKVFKAEIVEAHGIVNRSYDSTKAAKAKYNVHGKEITGKMICSCDHRLSVGDRVKIIVPKTDNRIFSISEKQVRDSLITHIIFVAVSVICLIITLGFLVYTLVHLVIDTC